MNRQQRRDRAQRQARAERHQQRTEQEQDRRLRRRIEHGSVRDESTDQ